MLEAARAWDAVAVSTLESATAVGGLLEGIGDAWLGKAALQMVATVAGHVAWLAQSATAAAGTARQANAAAAAYQRAHIATVHPREVAINREVFAGLVTTNTLGQNAPTIAAVESDYGVMWAQDAEAMLTYAARSAEATVLAELTGPAGAFGTGSTLPELVNEYVQSFLSSAPYDVPLSLLQVFSGLWSASSIGGAFAKSSATAIDNVPAALGQAAIPSLSVKVSTGTAYGLGRLSIPPSWGETPGARVIPAYGATAGAVTNEGDDFMLPMLPPMAGAAGSQSGRSRPEPEYGFKPKFTAMKGI